MDTRQMSQDPAPSGPGAGNIRDRIVALRRERIAREGHCFGHEVPETRQGPVLPFVTDPLLICEIKRRSPSRGDIAAGLDPVAQARIYRENGVSSVSILTEEDHFGGSLKDLMAVKQSVQGIAALRKDFLVDLEDVRVSYRAGADAVLLIASMLDAGTLGAMRDLAESLGMEALVEVHTAQEIAMVAPLKPRLMGINCRNLETFAMDRLLPVGLRPLIDWDCRVVFESGLFETSDGYFAGTTGFAGMLVGEAVVRDTSRIPRLLEGFRQGFAPFAAAPLSVRRGGGFWSRLADLRSDRRSDGTTVRPILKICGICSIEDARMARESGADILGFIFAESPRRCPPGLLQEVAALDCLKVAVVTGVVPPEVEDALARGWIHGVQFSGDESPGDCAGRLWPWYKALRPRTLRELSRMDDYRSPRVLLDAFHEGLYGGSGKQLDPDIAGEAALIGPLWLAGGIRPDNVAGIIEAWHPELIDIASGVEECPGKKSRAKLEELAKEIDRVCI